MSMVDAPPLLTHPRYMPAVLNGIAILPLRSSAVKQPRPPARASRSWMTDCAASWTLEPLSSISAATLYAAAVVMKYSPSPVQDTAAVALLAYVPAPMSGESPTRPGSLLLRPPVDVAAA